MYIYNEVLEIWKALKPKCFTLHKKTASFKICYLLIITYMVQSNSL